MVPIKQEWNNDIYIFYQNIGDMIYIKETWPLGLGYGV